MVHPGAGESRGQIGALHCDQHRISSQGSAGVHEDWMGRGHLVLTKAKLDNMRKIFFPSSRYG